MERAVKQEVLTAAVLDARAHSEQLVWGCTVLYRNLTGPTLTESLAGRCSKMSPPSSVAVYLEGVCWRDKAYKVSGKGGLSRGSLLVRSIALSEHMF